MDTLDIQLETQGHAVGGTETKGEGEWGQHAGTEEGHTGPWSGRGKGGHLGILYGQMALGVLGWRGGGVSGS